MQNYQTEETRSEHYRLVESLLNEFKNQRMGFSSVEEELFEYLSSKLQAREEWLRKSIEELGGVNVGPFQDNQLVFRSDVLSLLTNNEPELPTKG